MKYDKAIVKYNGGAGALLCNSCGIIIAYGYDHVDKIHTCNNCKLKNKNNENLREQMLKEVPKL